ncbi:hypothetical protein ACS0TY_013206 [Phlomoides rotata]
MITFVGKNLSRLNLKHTPPPVSSSFTHHFFYTSGETQLGHTPKVFDLLLHRHNFPPELASRVASELSHLNLEFTTTADSILSFLKESGFSNSQLVRIVKYSPRLLSINLDDRIKPKIKILREFGFSCDGICKMISLNPSILYSSVENNIVPSLSVLKGLLGSNDKVATVGRKAPWFLTANLQNTMVPNVEFLKSCGVPMDRVSMILTSYPRCFLIKPESIRKCAEKVNEMGIEASSKNFVYAVTTIAQMSNETLEHKLQAFKSLGFSDREILTMFSKEPRVLSTSMEKIKKITELLLATGKFNMGDIGHFPVSFMFSIEKRYTPRLRILGILESKNLIKEWPSLCTICTLSDDVFFKRFISPYLHQVGDAYIK